MFSSRHRFVSFGVLLITRDHPCAGLLARVLANLGHVAIPRFPPSLWNHLEASQTPSVGPGCPQGQNLICENNIYVLISKDFGLIIKILYRATATTTPVTDHYWVVTSSQAHSVPLRYAYIHSSSLESVRCSGSG